MSASKPILIIDDEPYLRLTLGLILSRAGYQIEEASTAADGMYMASIQPFDLILLDLQLPDREGLEILPELRALQPRTPVVILTANGSIEKAAEAMRRGAYEYLLKPVSPGEIIAQVDDILHQRGTGIEPAHYSVEELTAEDCTHGPLAPDDQIVRAGEVVLDLQNQVVFVREQAVTLPPCTFDYLVTLARHAPRPVDYATLVGESQGYWLPAVEAQDLARWRIYRLRRAIEVDPGEPRIIITQAGVGYRLAAR